MTRVVFKWWYACWVVSLLSSTASASPQSAAGHAGIPFPIPHPTTPTVCEYSGVFPLAGAPGTWTIYSGSAGEYSTELAEPAQVTGILMGRVPNVDQAKVSSTKLHSLERINGRVLSTHDQMVVILDTDAGAVTYDGAVKSQHVCNRPSGLLKQGAPIECTVTSRDSWEITGSLELKGSQETRSTYTTRFEATETITSSSGETVTANVLVTVWDDGLHEWRWHDPQNPWCPIKVERRRLGKVVGTDRLQRIEASSPIKIIPRRGNMDLVDMAGKLLLFGSITIGCACILAWLAGRKAPPGSNDAV